MSVVFVFGGTAGIGLATARRLARKGWKVAIGGRDADRCDDAVAYIASDVPSADPLGVAIDIGHTSEAERAIVATVEKFGRLDAVVNCVGAAPSGTFDAVASAEWIQSIDSKAIGAVRGMQAALPYLRNSQNARVVNVAGSAGKEPAPTMAVAAAANGALLALTRAVATQLAEEGIAVNAVAPGPTETGRWQSLVRATATREGIDEAQAEEQLRVSMPTGRPTSPDEVAALIAFLLSPEAGHIMGAVVTIDGGQSRGF